MESILDSFADNANVLDETSSVTDELKGTEDVKKESSGITSSYVISIILFIGILFFESTVWLLGKEYYQTMEYSVFASSVISFNLEAVYLYSSAQRELKYKVLAILLLAVSMNCLQHTAFSKDKNISSYKDDINRQVEIKTGELKALTNTQWPILIKEQKSLQYQMQRYVDQNLITKGNMKLAEPKRILRTKIKEFKQERVELNKEISTLNKKIREISLFSSFSMLEQKTKVTIITFLILQIAICVLLPSIIKGVKRGGL